MNLICVYNNNYLITWGVLLWTYGHLPRLHRSKALRGGSSCWRCREHNWHTQPSWNFPEYLFIYEELLLYLKSSLILPWRSWWYHFCSFGCPLVPSGSSSTFSRDRSSSFVRPIVGRLEEQCFFQIRNPFLFQQIKPSRWCEQRTTIRGSPRFPGRIINWNSMSYWSHSLNGSSLILSVH